MALIRSGWTELLVQIRETGSSRARRRPITSPGAAFRSRFERPLGTFRYRHLEDVERHRDQRVIAHDADELDDAALAELRESACVVRVVDLVIAVEDAAEIIKDALVLAGEIGRAALGDGGDDRRI